MGYKGRLSPLCGRVMEGVRVTLCCPRASSQAASRDGAECPGQQPLLGAAGMLLAWEEVKSLTFLTCSSLTSFEN